VNPAVRSEAAETPAAPVTRGVVSRRALVGQIEAAERVIVVSAPAGSGKTFLLRSWIGEGGLADRAAWVSVQREERDPQRLWVSVADALRDTAAASALVRPLTAAPDLDGWAIVERLLKDLAPLEDPVWLVIDDLNELTSADGLRQLELLVMRAPATLRFVLATRHDLQLRLHRLRLEGELTEIRAADLRFTVDEARELFGAAGVRLPDAALGLLHERAEGWAAGLRLAALSLAGHPDPERFAEEFSGSERMVADYLLAEVLERQNEQVRRLLLRTSVLERVSGELADLLTGGSGGERALQGLEAANAFVVSLDARRSWFRYHQLFADLLQLELRNTAPDELGALHGAAAGWYARHGYPVEAVRHAQAAQDWGLATRLLSDHWFGLVLNGQAATARELLTRFPADVVVADAELNAMMAAEELARGSLEEAEHHLALAARGLPSVPAERRGRCQVMLAVLRMRSARQRGDLPAVTAEAQGLLGPVEAAAPVWLGLGEDLRALALIDLGVTELWTAGFDEADRHLRQGIALARRIGRPYLEVTGLAHLAQLVVWRSFPLSEEQSRLALDLAEAHGWADEPIAGVAYMARGMAMLSQGRLEEAERSLELAERTLQIEAEPAAGMRLHYARGVLEWVSGRHYAALEAFRRAERLAGLLVTEHTYTVQLRSRLLQAHVRMGETQRVERALSEMAGPARDGAEMRTATAVLRLAQGDPTGATVALAPVIDGSAAPMNAHLWWVHAWLLEAIARDALREPGAARRALERALDLAKPERQLLPFLIDPAPELLERHRQLGTAHAALISDILNLLAGKKPEARPDSQQGRGLLEPLSQSEIRVLRYLPTSLTVPEIADQLYVSVNTVRTHTRHIYDKLGAHRRHEVVEQARALGLLAPATRIPRPREA
jgi:LuxR family transcriptional regulator, maltose regulon positive regulatory protein